jgi:DNA-binding MarR family transcriptional regulator
MSVDLIPGLWRGLSAAFAHEEGLDPALLLARHPSHVQPHDPLSIAAGRMRMRASYVLVTGYGVGMSDLARRCGLKKQAISKALRDIEDRRDIAAENELIERVSGYFGVPV